MPFATVRDENRFPRLDEGIDLSSVSELYEDGGEQLVREGLGLEDWPQESIDKLIAHAHARYPIDFERAKAVEGVHPGLAASAMREGLRAKDPKVKKGSLDTYLRHEGLLAETKDVAAMAMEAMTKALEVLAGQAQHPSVTIDVADVSSDAYTFPEPTTPAP